MASYLRPTRIEEALAALASGKRTVLAGGTDHFPARAVREPDEDIVDITAIDRLRGIERQGGTWRLPALTTWSELVRTPLPPLFDGLKAAARQVGGMQIQNAGTLAGNVCNASPAADGVPPLLAMDAAVELRSAGGVRVLPLGAFILGPRQTVRQPDELVTALLVPDSAASSRFLKLGARRYLVISISMVALSITQDAGGRVSQAAVAVGACGPKAIRLPGLEAALLGALPHPAAVQPAHLAPLIPIDDIRAPAQYRMEATLELLRRGLAAFAPGAPLEHAA